MPKEFKNQIKFFQFILLIFLALTLNCQPAFAGEQNEAPLVAQQAAKSSLSPGAGDLPAFKQFKDCDVCSEMVVLQAGEYMMGATPDDFAMMKSNAHSAVDKFFDNLEYARETPQQLVHIESFAIAKFDVTRGQFAVFAKETHFEGKGCTATHAHGIDRDAEADWADPWFKQTDRDPVVCVSWNDAQKFIAWINSKVPPDKAHYRLPTEAEWEYAARAGTTTPTYWNDPAKQCQYVNANDLSTKDLDWAGYNRIVPANCNDGYTETSPVDAFPPNPWGLYDMLGNVSQLTADCASSGHFSYANTPRTDCKRISIRGPSWSVGPADIRAAFRGLVPPNNRSSVLGFRLAVDLPN